MRVMKEWLKDTRSLMAKKAMNNPGTLLSVNDVFAAIDNREMLAPPKRENVRSGLAMCNVFVGAPYFRNTGMKTASTNPSNKGRKVSLWEYLPELDDRSVPTTRSKFFFNPTKEWA